MVQDHAHHHDRVHSGTAARAFLLGALLNLGIVVLEVIYGVLARSMALVADAGHNLVDVLGVAIGGLAVVVGRRRASLRRSYGLKSASILAAFFNACLLLVATGAIAWEAIRRLVGGERAATEPVTVIVVALVGTAVNVGAALLFLRGRHVDLNERSAFLHLAGDAVISIGVAASGVVMLATGLRWVDPAVSLVLSAAIFAQAVPLLRRATNLALHAVPEAIDPVEVRAHLLAVPGVTDVHDMHIWAMSTTETALTAHLAMVVPQSDATFYRSVASGLKRAFRIEHATIQVETCDFGRCSPCTAEDPRAWR
jgi:cobalt-zinc-cadmium efflux system protein